MKKIYVRGAFALELKLVNGGISWKMKKYRLLFVVKRRSNSSLNRLLFVVTKFGMSKRVGFTAKLH